MSSRERASPERWVACALVEASPSYLEVRSPRANELALGFLTNERAKHVAGWTAVLLLALDGIVLARGTLSGGAPVDLLLIVPVALGALARPLAVLATAPTRMLKILASSLDVSWLVLTPVLLALLWAGAQRWDPRTTLTKFACGLVASSLLLSDAAEPTAEVESASVYIAVVVWLAFNLCAAHVGIAQELRDASLLSSWTRSGLIIELSFVLMAYFLFLVHRIKQYPDCFVVLQGHVRLRRQTDGPYRPSGPNSKVAAYYEQQNSENERDEHEGSPGSDSSKGSNQTRSSHSSFFW